jgi:hypothetical protein
MNQKINIIIGKETEIKPGTLHIRVHIGEVKATVSEIKRESSEVKKALEIVEKNRVETLKLAEQA